MDRGDVSAESEPPPPLPPPAPRIFTPVPVGTPEPPPSRLVLLAKFLLHGLVLNVLMLIVVFLWAFLAVGLVICGYLLGLFLAIVILVIVYGYLNAWITRVVWFNVETGLLACFFHGLLLFIASLVPAVIWVVLGGLFPWTGSGYEYHYLFVSVLFPTPAVLVLGYLLNFAVMGYLGRGVASIWKREPFVVAGVDESPEA